MFGIVSSLPFLVASLAMLIGGIAIIKFSKDATSKALKKYKYKVNARIIGKQKVNSNQNSRNNMDVYASVYEYMYGGKYYNTVSKFGSSINNDQIGAYKTIYVNPDNPEDIYELNVGKVLSTIGIIVGIIFVIAAISALIMCIGLILTISKDFESNYDDLTDIVMGIVIGLMILKTVVIIACLVVVRFVYSYYKNKSERCRSEVYAKIVNKGNGYPVNMSSMNPQVLEYAFGQIYQKPLPDILGFILSKINPQGMKIFINHKKPTEIYHPIEKKIVMTIVCVVAGAIAFFVFGNLFFDFIEVLEMYGFGF